MNISDTPSCGITYDHHSDASGGFIWDCNIFIIQTTGVKIRNHIPRVSKNLSMLYSMFYNQNISLIYSWHSVFF